MTDLETTIRDALHSRAEAVQIRHSTLVAHRRRRWLPPTLAAALVIALVALTVVALRPDHSRRTSPASDPHAIVGHTWVLERIDDSQGTLVLPALTHIAIQFQAGGRMTGDDSIHSFDAHYRIVAAGYKPSDVTVSGNGIAGRVPADLKRKMGAVQSCFESVRSERKPPVIASIPASVSGNHLVLHTSYGVLTFRLAGTGPGG
jgi:hypothetical protein